MKRITLLAAFTLSAVCSFCVEPSPFSALLAQPLSDVQRVAVVEACDDFAAVLAFKKPIHAKPDEFGIKDGGSWGYNGRGYRIIVWCGMSSFDHQVTLYAYGPDVRFDRDVLPTVNTHITQVALYHASELAKRLEKSFNKAPLPTPMSVTPPAGQEARQP